MKDKNLQEFTKRLETTHFKTLTDILQEFTTIIYCGYTHQIPWLYLPFHKA